MSKQTRILLCGNSLVIEGIGAGLRTEAGFDVVRDPHPLPGGSDLKVLDPEVIIFDIERPGHAAVFSALEDNPDLVLLGVSSDANVVRVWSGRSYEELSVGDLTALIDAGAHSTVSTKHNASRQGR